MRILRFGIGTVVLALTLIMSSQEQAPAAPKSGQGVVYESRRAYTVFEDQVLEGTRAATRARNAARWVVPVLLPKDSGRGPEAKPAPEPDVDTTVIWEIVGKAPSTAPAVIVDGINPGPAEPCLGALPLPDCLSATFSLSRGHTSDAHHRVQLVQGPYRSPLDTITLRPTSPFILLLSTFRHDRCETCHGMQGDPDRTAVFHAQFFPVEGLDFVHSANCRTCHLEANTGVPFWRSPESVDFRSVEGAKALCEFVVKIDTAPELQEHFGADERIEWAIVNGWVPFGFPVLPTAPPHDITKFREYADRWLMSRKFGLCKGLP